MAVPQLLGCCCRCCRRRWRCQCHRHCCLWAPVLHQPIVCADVVGSRGEAPQFMPEVLAVCLQKGLQRLRGAAAQRRAAPTAAAAAAAVTTGTCRGCCGCRHLRCPPPGRRRCAAVAAAAGGVQAIRYHQPEHKPSQDCRVSRLQQCLQLAINPLCQPPLAGAAAAQRDARRLAAQRHRPQVLQQGKPSLSFKPPPAAMDAAAGASTALAAWASQLSQPQQKKAKRGWHRTWS